MVDCPLCGNPVKESKINTHIDSGCQSFVEINTPDGPGALSAGLQKSTPVSSFFQTQSTKKAVTLAVSRAEPTAQHDLHPSSNGTESARAPQPSSKRLADVEPNTNGGETLQSDTNLADGEGRQRKRSKLSNALQRAAPLAERMRPRTLDEVFGQELVGPSGVLRGLIEQDKVPSMILWGGAGMGRRPLSYL